MEIYSFPVKGYDVDMTLREGFLAYTFQRKNPKTKENESFGHKIKVGTEPMELVSAASLLVINAYDSIEALDKKKVVSRRKTKTPTE